MKRIFVLSLTIFVATASFAAPASVEPESPKSKIKASEIYVPLGKSGHTISLLDLSTIRVKDVERITGKKMKLSEKIAFKMGQKKLAREIRPDGTINAKKLEGVVAKKFASEQSRKYLRLWLLLLGAAILLSILGIFVPFLWIISAIAGLGATVFFILWLIALADS